MRRRIIACVWLASLLIAMALPSPASRWFDGLPWTTIPEIVFLLAALGVAGSAGARSRIEEWTNRRSTALAAIVWTLPVWIALLKVACGAWASPAGFAACYSHLVANVERPPCERSFAAPFASSAVTRFDHDISFEADWRLGFLNSSRFNFYSEGQHIRTRLPFHATWLGEVEFGEGESLEVFYAGEGSFVIGPTSVALPADYVGGHVTATLPPGRHRLAADYTYDDGSRRGKRAAGSRAVLSARIVSTDGMRPLTTAAPRFFDALLVGALDLASLAAAAVLLVGLTNLTRALLAGVLGTVWLLVMSDVRLDSWIVVVCLAGIAAAVAFVPRLRRLDIIVPVTLTIAGVLTFSRLGAWEILLIRDGGQDWLTYESQARTILETGSLEGGEAVYYYQPFYRYAKFVLRLLLGEADFLPFAAINAAYIGGILLMTGWLAGRLSLGLRPVAALAAVGPLAILTSARIQTLTVNGLSEPLAWALFPIAVALLFGTSRFACHLFGIALLGVCAVTRLNHLPAVMLSAGTFYLYWRPRSWSRRLLPLAVLASILALPLAHNLYYGGQFVLTTRSVGISQNLRIPPGSLVNLPRDAALRKRLGARASQMVSGAAGWLPSELLGAGLRLCQLCWVGAIALAAWRRTWFHAAVILLPASYLAVHFLYQISVYYPRHIVAGHLAMAASILLAGLIRPDRDESGAGMTRAPA